MDSQRRQRRILLPRIHSFSDKIDVNCPELVAIISYPRKISDTEYRDRLKELEIIGVSSILQGGITKIGTISILGKGGVGLVVKVERNDRKTYALKIRRIDANRSSMDREGNLHRIANTAGVGPSIFANTKNFILMEFIDGLNIIGWLNQQSVKVDQVRRVVISTLEQCYNLDRAHLDHGELNCLARHVLIPESLDPRIIDFETASIDRKTTNVTASAHSLLLHGRISRRVGKFIGFVERETMLRLLRVYKRDQTRQNFEKIIQQIG